MDSYENQTHPFVVKVWLEEPSRWRGYIVHVPTGKQRHFEDLDDVIDFIALYLEDMGADLGSRRRIVSGLRRWMRRAGVKS